jgi:hypothetical protein
VVKSFPLFGKKMLAEALANRKHFHDPSVYQRDLGPKVYSQ